MKLSIIAALSSNNVIGRNNEIPWRQSTDLKRLKALTMGHHLIMGRKTYDSVGRPLPGRTTIIITRQADYAPKGATAAPAADKPAAEAPRVVVVNNLEDAIRMAREARDDEAFIAGGAEIYEQAMHRADRMYLTRVHAEIEGDAFFPEFDDVSEWQLTDAEHCEADERNQYPYSFLTYDRAGAQGHAIPEEG